MFIKNLARVLIYISSRKGYLMNKERLMVIGNGMAGVATIEQLLTKREDMEITIFGNEPHVNYNRVLLSSVLAGEMGAEEIILNSSEWYEKNGITLHSGVSVTKIDIKEKTLTASNSVKFPFDKLLIATGSVPFIPPVKGIWMEEKGGQGGFIPGVFTFRTLDDTTAMMQWAKNSRKALVIGGGLLGIEAAVGLIGQGVDVTIVHLMDRLMEMQLDLQGAEILKRELSRMGIHTLLSHCAEEVIVHDNRLEGIRFNNGRAYEADMIVIAAGIRPNIGLAKDGGIKTNKGIIVNDYLETDAKNIFAVGECVEHRGKLYGIVAPLMEQARAAADAIAGNYSLQYEGSVTAIRLKVAGIPLVSMGNFKGGTGCEEIVYSDPAVSIYKKLVVSGGRLVGSILLGDIDGYNRYSELLQNQEDISLQRKTLLTGNARAIKSVASMPDTTTICGCKGITKGTIVKAIEEYGLTSLKEVSEKTTACTSCKGCAPQIEQILQDVLGGEYVKQDIQKVFCDCIPMTWEEIRKNVITASLKSVSEVLNVLGNGSGCSGCKPGINFMLQEIFPDDYKKEEDALFENDRYHANIQKDGTFSVVPRMYGGVTTPDQLRRIADVADKYDVPMVKITGGQRIDLLGIKGELLPSVWADLGYPSGHAYAKAVRTVKTCVGDTLCRYGVQDSIALGIRMEKLYQGIPCPAKIKMAVSGCPRNCSETTIKDIGVVGIQTGWEIYVGGNGGVKVRIADLLTVVTTMEEVIDITGIFLQYYRENGRWMERTSHFVERVGIDHIKEVVLEDSLGIADRLRKRINEVASAYKDPWAEEMAESIG